MEVSPRALVSQVAELQARVSHLEAQTTALQAQLQPLLEAERRAASAFQPRQRNPSQTFDLLRHRLLHFEGCFQFLVQALSQRFPETRWQSLEET